MLAPLCWGPVGHLFENRHKTPRFRDMPKMTTKLRDPTGKKMGVSHPWSGGPWDPSLKLRPFPSPRTLGRPYQKEPLPARAQRQNRDHSKEIFKVCCSNWGLPWWLRWWRIGLPCRRPGFDSWVGKIPLEKGMATHCSILVWRIPWMGYSPWGHKELDTTEWLTNASSSWACGLRLVLTATLLLWPLNSFS